MERIYRSPDPFFLRGHGDLEGTAVLAIHGFTGSPSEFRRLGYALNDLGYTFSAVQLPGHGTTPEDMLRTGWGDWWHHVLESYDALRSQGYTRIIAAGHSMGGLLALKLAMEREVEGVVSLAAPIYLSSRKTALAFLMKYIVTYVEKNSSVKPHILDEVWAYSKTPVACVASLRKLLRLVRCSLERVKVPIWIGQGTLDGTVQPRSALYIYERVSSERKELKIYPRSSHALLLDQEREQVYADVAIFLDGLCPAREDARVSVGVY